MSSSREQLCTKPRSKDTWRSWEDSWRPELPSRKKTRWEISKRLIFFLYFHCVSHILYTHKQTPTHPHSVSLTVGCVSAGGHGGPLGLQRRQPAGPAAPPRPGSQAHLQRQGWLVGVLIPSCVTKGQTICAGYENDLLWHHLVVVLRKTPKSLMIYIYSSVQNVQITPWS